jgi:DNA (cytosine-5)-methyltransferase 1
MKVLDLFSGIGGFSLGLGRAGMQTVGFCEIDPFCRSVLAEHWLGVPIHDDITTRQFQEGEADVICGGFPCQDISVAGAGAGIAGERSGLWRELVRAIRVVRPRFAIVENVAALLSRGMGTVLGDLAEIGHDAEWHCIPARAIGAPHRRDRVWIVVHSNSGRGSARQQTGAALGHGRSLSAAGCGLDHAERRGLQAGRPERTRNDGPLRGGREHPRYLQATSDAGSDVADAEGRGQRADGRPSGQTRHSNGSGETVADPISAGLEGCTILSGYIAAELAAVERGGSVRDADGIEQISLNGIRERPSAESAGSREGGWWLVEPDVGRVAHGVPARVDRLRSLGNAVVPQIPEIIGRAIYASLTDAPLSSRDAPSP